MAVRGCFKILCYAFCSAPVRFTLQLSKQYFYITDSSLFFLSAVIYLQLGSSLSPSIMTGGTYQRIGAIAPWRSVLLFSLRFQPEQQTALAAVFAILLLGFEKPCFWRANVRVLVNGINTNNI